MDVDALKLALADAEKALGAAEARLGAATRIRDERRAEVQGLRLAIRRHQPPEDATVADDPPLAQLSDVLASVTTDMTRTDAVAALLQAIRKPLSPTEIARFLRAAGRSDEPQLVSAALAHLQRQGRVRSGGRGQWHVAEPELPLPTYEEVVSRE